MKYYFQLIVFAIFFSSANAQQELTGMWYSDDSSRIYYMHKTDSGFKAVIYSSNRKHDYTNAIILTDIHAAKEKDSYTGFIYSIYNSPPLPAKIFLSNNGSVLKIKIPRMYLFPVHINWVRKE